MNWVKYGILTGACVITGAIAWNVYAYFFDLSCPTFLITGIQEGKTYAGDIQCSITGSDEYKVQDISIFVDGTPIVHKYKIGKREFDYMFALPTKSMPNGAHKLAIELLDGSYNKHKARQELTFFVDNQPLQAAFVKVEAEHKVFQGRMLHLQFQVNKEIARAKAYALSHEYCCCRESSNSNVYECFIPIACEEIPDEYLITIEVADHVGTLVTLEKKFQVVAYPFKRQRVTVNTEKLKQEEELGKPKHEREALLEAALKDSPNHKLWHGSFYPPIEIKSITAEFGILRTTQEKGRYIHQGIDVTNAPRSVVWAPQDGRIILKDRYQDTGNTVVIDHGCGLFTLLCHLDSFAAVEVGMHIKKGEPVGTIGMTGYADGYHLHWETRLMNVPVDPMQLTKNSF